MKSNKKLGNRFEEEFCEILARHGFWVHRLTQSADGQPADIIAVKNKQAFLIDCKLCTDGKFPLSRIEENQRLAMERWRECGNGEGLFAIKIDRDIFMLPLSAADELCRMKSVLYPSDLDTRNGWLERWLLMCE